MITNKQKQFLIKYLSGKPIARRTVNIYLNRIQKRIDEQLENLTWLATFAPDIFRDLDREFEEYDLPRNRRLIKLITVIKHIAGENVDNVIVELVKNHDKGK